MNSILKLKNSFPYDLSLCTEEELFWWNQFPQDYRDFISKQNGGKVVSKKNNFRLNIEGVFGDRVSTDTTNVLEDLFGFISFNSKEHVPGNPPSIMHMDLSYSSDQFLPNNVYVIGRCMQSCLIAISINEYDHGCIYYWDYYWNYPWFEKFFTDRIEKAKSCFDDPHSILEDEEHPQYQEAYDALNYATIVKVGESFSDFLEGLHEPAPVTESETQPILSNS